MLVFLCHFNLRVRLQSLKLVERNWCIHVRTHVNIQVPIQEDHQCQDYFPVKPIKWPQSDARCIRLPCSNTIPNPSPVSWELCKTRKWVQSIWLPHAILACTDMVTKTSLSPQILIVNSIIPNDKKKWLIIIIIAFKAAVQDFLQSPRCAVNCLQHVRSSGQGTIVCKSRATHQRLSLAMCCVPLGTKGQLSY